MTALPYGGVAINPGWITLELLDGLFTFDKSIFMKHPREHGWTISWYFSFADLLLSRKFERFLVLLPPP
jgi:hypothetical protein